MKVVAVIPCYNESKFIKDVVRLTKPHVERVIVADDFSSDDTCVIAESCGAVVVSNNERLGFSRNVKIGISKALSCKADIVVMLDGDGQHNPNEIPNVVKPIKCGEADIVVGHRVVTSEMPRYRRFGNDVLNWLYNVVSTQKLPDTTCGFRAFSCTALETLSCVEEGHYSIALEALVKARVRGMRIMSVPVSCIYHERFDDNSTMSPILMGLSLAWVVVKWRLKMGWFRRNYN